MNVPRPAQQVAAIVFVAASLFGYARAPDGSNTYLRSGEIGLPS